MFTKVLVANRGEIAVRVIRACRELGIKSVAIYSDLDRNSLHTRLADEAYALGGSTAAESYLDIPKILQIIETSGADAVHPGYGFFSENAEFAEQITERGITFIGPPPDAIRIMGDKISARRAAEKVGVSGVPGTTDFIEDSSEVSEFAKEHGYPIAIKAAYGGGGRGMKVVHGEEEIQGAIDSAQREAVAYFGRGELYMERYLTKPRHIEVQVLADSHGKTLHLGTRDCSAQRRHQKLIEEAPASGIDPAILQEMGEAAVAVAEGCNYVNAGTVEFLYENGAFYYLEMNTRLQVEHPVTEMVTGIDLVRQQLLIAQGEKLQFSQEDIEINGHAIEVRINAENPAGGAFLPSPGKLMKFKVPAGFGTRWDGGYEEGDEISQFYDNLIGKLVCWGEDRDIATARTVRALDEFEIHGLHTTIPADRAILTHSDFANLEHSTKWVEEELDLSALPSLDSADLADEAGLTERSAVIEVEGKQFNVSMWIPDSSKGTRRRATAAAGSSGGGDGKISVPMQGTIVKVAVKVGDEVAPGDVLIVLEAMKMENNVTSDVAGKVAEILTDAGDSVGAGDVVLIIDID
ncbi:MAG: acetyl-CoA carboxylase biotin carboxylase subunit [Actinomycetota bacterium]|nr:acetyl-CoA carboxylase biotin carboxylase subunit [Actinomycetota bacterium]